MWSVIDVQLVGFADALQKGYDASVYLHLVDSEERIHIYFIACKTKLAPLKASKTDISLTVPVAIACCYLLSPRVVT